MKIISVIMILLCVYFAIAGLKGGEIGKDAYFIALCMISSAMLISSHIAEKDEKKEKQKNEDQDNRN